MESGIVRTKYPRTHHHPSSPGVQSDDKIAQDLTRFEGQDVVITEKMDGENTTLYRNGYHARSIDSAYHPSRDWVARFQAQVGYLIPEGWRICGENMYAQHAIPYDALHSYFLGFSIWDHTNVCLSWQNTLKYFDEIGITPVRQIYSGPYISGHLTELAAAQDTSKLEGLVMRTSAAFDYVDFGRNVVKWVRKGHVQSETHWSKAPLTPNCLVEGDSS